MSNSKAFIKDRKTENLSQQNIEAQKASNNLDDPDLLLAVNSFTNREKSAYGPEDWKPDNTKYWCEYAYDWIRIKYEWGLTATQREWGALLEMIETCPKDFTFEDAINNSHIFSDEKIERYKH